MSHLELAGAGLLLLFRDAKVRSFLEALEIDHDVPKVIFCWTDRRRSTFAPYEPREWRRRKKEALGAGMRHLVRLPGRSVDKIVKLLHEQENH